MMSVIHPRASVARCLILMPLPSSGNLRFVLRDRTSEGTGRASPDAVVPGFVGGAEVVRYGRNARV